MDDMTTWRAELAAAMIDVGDSGPVTAYAPDETAFDVEFNPEVATGGHRDVYAWTPTRVYFVAVNFDESLRLDSAPRDPVS